VVRLAGPRRVEVHQPGQKPRIANAGEQLEAPGILANPVPVEALWDREAGLRVTFRNLLQRQGYASLDEVRAEGEAHGRAEGEAHGRAEGEAHGRAEGEAHGRAEGEIQGLRKAIVTVLSGRGLAVDDPWHTVLASCGDPAVLEAALLQAATASAAEILATLRA
jgi:hypothetical protein